MKSKKSIFDAFVNLRSKKELRKITVKELCEKALINKSTFYTYYEDMFDLSDKIESEVVDGIVSTISNPQMMIDEPVKFYRNLLGAMTENKALTNTVFSGSQHPNLIVKLSKSLKNMIFENCPEYINDKKFCTLLDYAIYGGFQPLRSIIHKKTFCIFFKLYYSLICAKCDFCRTSKYLFKIAVDCDRIYSVL